MPISRSQYRLLLPLRGDTRAGFLLQQVNARLCANAGAIMLSKKYQIKTSFTVNRLTILNYTARCSDYKSVPDIVHFSVGHFWRDSGRFDRI
jgi:hypothetical protein